MINVIIVDDSAFMRKIISDILSSDSRIEVIGTARDGEDACVKVASLRPDVVTLDVEMPGMSGMEFLAEIMATNPLPVIMLSSITQSRPTRAPSNSTEPSTRLPSPTDAPAPSAVPSAHCPATCAPSASR